ncbi:MAG: AAA family ATPase [Cylindrospermopsis raciborskii KL1]|jgi:hypothetical protein|uniref:AAA family ATPase n=1 Tax=Cylindrospermopsis raciborskii TaxID=77022 RepID=UPI001A292AC0|nr:ATP-binding protein [Cylindrospermopsis raciborskii]MBG0743227.1 AAA family ATPase [Cylindrospermopsis raciborskii KL1]
MIREVEIRGFKSLSQVDFELGRVNCIIGANGTGKSNLLEALGVLGAAANGIVDDESLLRRGVRAGLPRLYKSSFLNERIPGHIAIGVKDDCQASYRVSLLNPLEKPDPAWSYKTEFLSDGQREIVADGVRNKKNLNPQAGLAALQIVEIEPANPAAKLMHRLQNFAIYCPNTPTLRGILSDQQPRNPVGLNGGQLAEGFADLQNYLKSQKEGEDLLDQVLELIDWAAEIETSSDAGTLLSRKIPRSDLLLTFVDRFMSKERNQLTAYDASEGALYILFTAILCIIPQAPQILAIDNLDQSLNPRLLVRLISRLPSWLDYQNADRQILFTIHNPAGLDGLDLSDPEIRLFVVERNSNGQTNIRRLELTSELIQLNQKYPLSRLWLMGNLGGVPNV